MILTKKFEFSVRANSVVSAIYYELYCCKDTEETIKTRLKIHGKKWRNCGCNLDDGLHRRTIEFFEEIKVSLKFGNDSKFGGKEGDFICFPIEFEEFLKLSFLTTSSKDEFFELVLCWVKIRLADIKLNIL